MKRRLLHLILLLTIGLLPTGDDVFAKKARSSKRSKVVKKKRAPAKSRRAITKRAKSRKPVKKKRTLDEKFGDLKMAYAAGKFTKAKFWNELTKFEEIKSKLSKGNQASLGQIQATMLMADNYPVLAAIYASEVLGTVQNPLKEEYRKAWYVLAKVYHRRSMQDLVEDLAGTLKLGAKVPPYFGTDWFYYEGNAESLAGRKKSAINNYRRLQLNDRHYLTAKYQTAMLHLEDEDFKRAESAMKTMLNAANYTQAPIPFERKKELGNFAKIGLARLYYQQQKFKTSIAFYRAVDRESQHFYDSLFEQSWAFFMAGFPNHSLGALHGVESPFYGEVFNPEAAMLRSIVYYWMCRYDDSRSALADFTERNGDDVEKLTNYLSRKRLTNEMAYDLFENHVTGVSGASLGLPKRILETASSESPMLLLRDQLAYSVYELEQMQVRGIYKNKRNPAQGRLLTKRIGKLKNHVGDQFLVQLRSLKVEYERLYEQAEFLYIELLMSEKEQLLGRELHASSKIDRVTRRKKIIGWAGESQAWSDSKKNEFWWDEVGFYIYDVKPLCKAAR